jgi:hypothetical protein
VTGAGAYCGSMGTPPPCGLAPVPEDDPGAYVGMPVGEAERTAASRGWRTVRSLPPDAVITMEYVAGRLNFVVADGSVIRAWHG